MRNFSIRVDYAESRGGGANVAHTVASAAQQIKDRRWIITSPLPKRNPRVGNSGGTREGGREGGGWRYTSSIARLFRSFSPLLCSRSLPSCEPARRN